MLFRALLFCIAYLCLDTEPVSAVGFNFPFFKKPFEPHKLQKPFEPHKFQKPFEPHKLQKHFEPHKPQKHFEPHKPQKPSRPECDKEYLFFEFTTAVHSVKEVKKLFSHVEVLYAFKVMGAGRYFFIVWNDHSQGLKDLYLPDDSQATAVVYPVETMKTFLWRFQVEHFPGPADRLPHKDLLFIEKEWLAQGLTSDQYRAIVREQFSKSSTIDVLRNAAPFVAVGYQPTRFLIFLNLNDCEVGQTIFDNVDIFGGFGSVVSRSLRIYSIH